MHASHEIVVHIAALLKIKQIRYVAQIKLKTHKRKKKRRKERRQGGRRGGEKGRKAGSRNVLAVRKIHSQVNGVTYNLLRIIELRFQYSLNSIRKRIMISVQ